MVISSSIVQGARAIPKTLRAFKVPVLIVGGGSEAEGFSSQGEYPGLGYGASPEGLFDTSGSHRIQPGVSFERNLEVEEEDPGASALGVSDARSASLRGKAGVLSPNPGQSPLVSSVEGVEVQDSAEGGGAIVPGPTPTMKG